MHPFFRLNRFFSACLLALAALTAGSHAAHATHARYMNISWSVPNPAAPNVVNIRVESAWRRSFFGAPVVGASIGVGSIVVTGDGFTASPTLPGIALNPTVTVVNTVEDWIMTVQNTTYTFPATTANYMLTWDLCCRISTLADGNNDVNMRATSRVTVRMTPLAPNSSPTSTMLPIISVQAGVTSTFAIPATDRDGDTLTFRLATLAESTLNVAAPAGFSVSPSGIITFTPAPLATGSRLHAVQIVVTDSRNAYTVLDFLLSVRPPVGLPPAIKLNNATGPLTLNVQSGTPVSFRVSATDPENGSIALDRGSLPPGSSMSPSLPLQLVNPFSDFSWTPTAAQIGTFVIPFAATDPDANQATTSVTINVSSRPPTVSCTPNASSLEFLGTHFALSASVGDPDGTPVTVRFFVDGSEVQANTGVAVPGVVNYVSTANLGLGNHTYEARVSDGFGLPVSCTGTFTVVDTTKPVLTLLGANPQTIEAGSAYVELGATASDAGDPTVNASKIVINSSAVNTSVVGTYTVSYSVADASGNTATASRTVTVVDTTKPVLTLLGANPQTIEAGSAYVELGATASDVGDPTVTAASVVIDSSAVNTAAVGTYAVSYSVTDASGNVATASRTVVVEDTTKPVLTLIGANPQTIEAHSPYLELGATASDSFDTTVTDASIVINSSAVNTSVTGTYTVSYSVADASGNVATASRTVIVVDTTKPVLTLLGDNPQTIEAGSAYVELNATASDVGDPTVTAANIVINSSAVNTAVVGTYAVSYSVADASGNTATASRTVIVVDTTKPVLTLLGANPQTIEAGSAYVELGATASDVGDPTVTAASIVINSSAVNTAVVGTYAVSYSVADASGNVATASRVVIVVDTTKPVLALLGANPQTIEAGSAYVELNATASDVGDPTVTAASIVINSSAVNTAVVGTYAVSYSVADASGNTATASRVVIVVDTTKPLLALLGANPQTIEAGTAYVELGATASDVGDPTVTAASIIIDRSAVNTAVVGSYPVTYSVTDASGNTATVTRTVNVVITNTPPDCSLARPSVSILWPPNHAMIPVRILGVVDPDNNAVIRITGVTQDEATSGLGDGDKAIDAIINPDGTVLLRAERSGKGNGRVYHIHFTATDPQSSCSGMVTVSVPKSEDRRRPAIDGGELVDSTKSVVIPRGHRGDGCEDEVSESDYKKGDDEDRKKDDDDKKKKKK